MIHRYNNRFLIFQHNKVYFADEPDKCATFADDVAILDEDANIHGKYLIAYDSNQEDIYKHLFIDLDTLQFVEGLTIHRYDDGLSIVKDGNICYICKRGELFATITNIDRYNIDKWNCIRIKQHFTDPAKLVMLLEHTLRRLIVSPGIDNVEYTSSAERFHIGKLAIVMDGYYEPNLYEVTSVKHFELPEGVTIEYIPSVDFSTFIIKKDGVEYNCWSIPTFIGGVENIDKIGKAYLINLHDNKANGALLSDKTYICTTVYVYEYLSHVLLAYYNDGFYHFCNANNSKHVGKVRNLDKIKITGDEHTCTVSEL